MRRLIAQTRAEETGAVMVVAAISLFAIMALAALAIDGGLLQNDRSRAQNGADNAALAGAWAVCEGRDPVAAASTTASANGLGSPSSDATVTVVDLGDNSVRVTVEIGREAEFGKAIGTETLGVSATATAACTERRQGAAAIPFGVPPSGFEGGLQAPNPCGANSGNCGRLYVLRVTGPGGVGPDTVANIAYGSDRILTPWQAGHDLVNCSLETVDPECNVVPSNTGVSTGQLGDGFIQRFDDPADDASWFMYKSSKLNGDSLAEVLGWEPQSLEDAGFDPTKHNGAPPGWDPGIHGNWGEVDVSKHVWIGNQPILKCNSPRLASALIVTADMTYDPENYDPNIGHPDPWPSGSKPMKVLEHYYVYIENPDEATDFQGSGNLKTASAIVLWLGDDPKCAGSGELPGPSATNPVIREVGLTS